MASRAKAPPKNQNGTVPQEQTFSVDLTGNECQLIHNFCTQVPIQGAFEKQVAAILQAKLEQLAPAEEAA